MTSLTLCYCTIESFLTLGNLKAWVIVHEGVSEIASIQRARVCIEILARDKLFDDMCSFDAPTDHSQ